MKYANILVKPTFITSSLKKINLKELINLIKNLEK